MRAQSDALVTSHRVHAFERAGHSRSADIEGEYGYARGLADTLACLDAVGLGSAHVAGYSDGAIIGLPLALEHPRRVRSVTAISANLDPSGFTDSVGSVPVLTALPTPEERGRTSNACATTRVCVGVEQANSSSWSATSLECSGRPPKAPVPVHWS
nr:alpha/beta fold hydrolase [Actinoplanes italicus]